jgi:hypothetical protein
VRANHIESMHVGAHIAFPVGLGRHWTGGRARGREIEPAAYRVRRRGFTGANGCIAPGEERGMEREHSGERVLARTFDTTPACPLGAAQCKPVQSGASNTLICHGSSTPLRSIGAPGFAGVPVNSTDFRGKGGGWRIVASRISR